MKPEGDSLRGQKRREALGPVNCREPCDPYSSQEAVNVVYSEQRAPNRSQEPVKMTLLVLCAKH